nr:MAG TPA: hypothetical protein [Bacteriophage sp.]
MTRIILEGFGISEWVNLGAGGILLVLVGVLILIFWNMYKHQNKEVESREEEIRKREEAQRQSNKEEKQELYNVVKEGSDTMTAAARKIEEVAIKLAQLVEAQGKVHTGPYTKQEEEEHERFNKEVYNTLTKIREKTSVSRALLFVYHNGSHSLNCAYNFIKFSLIGESYGKAYKSSYQDLQGRSSYIMGDWVSLLKEHRKGVIIKDIEELRDKDEFLYQFFNHRQVTGFIAQGVYDINDEMLLGFVIAEYVTATPSFSEEEWKENKTAVTRAADKFSAYMSISNEDERIRNSKANEDGGDE